MWSSTTKTSSDALSQSEESSGHPLDDNDNNDCHTTTEHSAPAYRPNVNKQQPASPLYQNKQTASTETSSSCESNSFSALGRYHCSESGKDLRRLYPVTGRPSNINDDYNISPKVLGTGCHGTVRGCVHRRTNQICAVKTVTKAKVRNLINLRQEIQILASLQHPSIIRIVDCYEDENYVHIVTEKCCGGELYDRIEQHHLTDDECFDERSAARIIKSLLEAVAYLHSEGLVHRDIKPENILFESQDDESPIKLIDFGLSRRHRHEIDSNMSNIRGTSYYMSPELLECNYSTPTDIWSTGVVAYLLLCGYPPFNGHTDHQIYAAISKNELNFPADIGWSNKSPECIDFIKCLLQKDPRRRYTAEEALLHPWIVEMTAQKYGGSSRYKAAPSLRYPPTDIVTKARTFALPFPPTDIFTFLPSPMC